ncbi:hypothetical protein D3C75_861720 [compost metagenome]
MAIENRTRRIGNRVLLIVAFRQNGIKRGNRTAARNAVTRALDQRRKFGKHGRRITFGCRRLTNSKSDFALRHRVAGEGVHNQQHVLTAIAEIFRNTGGVGCTLHT